MKSFYSNRSKLVFLLPGFILFTLFWSYVKKKYKLNMPF